MGKSKTDNYQLITNQILELLEKVEDGEWSQPWSTGTGLPRNGHTGRHYSGINVLVLWGEAMKQGYTSAEWMTYKQAKKEGGFVRKGESGTKISFFRFIEVDDEKSDDEDKKKIPLLRTYSVFNLDQIEGVGAIRDKEQEEIAEAWLESETGEGRRPSVDKFIEDTGAKIIEGHLACYAPSTDCVTLPPMDSFISPDHYYTTTFHELVHWTGHSSRLGRNLESRFGDDAYAFEELIAELGAAFVAGDFKLKSELKEESAKYIKHWIKVLKDDKYAIFTASREAKKAAEFLHEDNNQQEAEEAA